MGYEINNGIDFDSICNGRKISIFTGGQYEAIKASDSYWNGSAWVLFCPIPDPNYPFGFDFANGYKTDYGGGSFKQDVNFVYSGSGSYPWGASNDFILRSNIHIEVGEGESVEMRGHNPLDSIVWQIGPIGEGSYDFVKDFPMSSINYRMKVFTFYETNCDFSIETEVLSGGSPFIDFSGIPFPVNYELSDL